MLKTDAEREAYRVLHEGGLEAFDKAYPFATAETLDSWIERGLIRIKYVDGACVVRTFKKYVS